MEQRELNLRSVDHLGKYPAVCEIQLTPLLGGRAKRVDIPSCSCMLSLGRASTLPPLEPTFAIEKSNNAFSADKVPFGGFIFTILYLRVKKITQVPISNPRMLKFQPNLCH